MYSVQSSLVESLGRKFPGLLVDTELKPSFMCAIGISAKTIAENSNPEGFYSLHPEACNVTIQPAECRTKKYLMIYFATASCRQAKLSTGFVEIKQR